MEPKLVSLTIYYIQQPSMVQGVGDGGKVIIDDLYYLFHAIRRYYLWYKSKEAIYSYILERAIIGITKLIETYKIYKNTTITYFIFIQNIKFRKSRFI